jgi:hypothetical protein
MIKIIYNAKYQLKLLKKYNFVRFHAGGYVAERRQMEAVHR